jgi:hypothetical protein
MMSSGTMIIFILNEIDITYFVVMIKDSFISIFKKYFLYF